MSSFVTSINRFIKNDGCVGYKMCILLFHLIVAIKELLFYLYFGRVTTYCIQNVYAPQKNEEEYCDTDKKKMRTLRNNLG